MTCVFCDIANGTAFVRMVHANDQVMCFFPLVPELLGHTLIVSCAHYADLRDTPPDVGAAVFKAAQYLSSRFGEVFGTTAFNLMNASGQEAEQSVQHLHFHFMPRFAHDDFSTWPTLPPFKTDLDALLAKVGP